MANSYDETPEFWTSYAASINAQKQRRQRNDWSDERLYNLTQSPAFRQKHPKGQTLDGILENETQYQIRLMNIARGMRPRNLNQEELRATNFNINPAKGFFPVAESALDSNYLRTYNEEGERSVGPRSFVSLDIETDDRQRPISISALKFLYDTQTGKFHSAGSYQRFYETHQRDIRKTYEVHKLTPEILKRLRQQQGAEYSTGYFTDPREEKALREFIGGSTIVGQNVVQFDLPVLFHNGPFNNNVIDTVIAARNVWKGRPNGLEDIFKRVMGKTMDQAGLPHHDANADTLATMMVLEKMAKWKGPTGDAIRYVMMHPGTQLGPLNGMLENVGQVIKGSYQNIYNGENIGAHYMSAEKIRISAKERFGLSQSDVDNLTDPLNLTDAELLQTAQAEIGGRGGHGFIPSETIKDLQSAYNAFGFWKKASLVREISKARSQDEVNALLESAGFSGKMGEHLTDMAARLRGARERDDRTEFEIQKERRIERMKRHGQLLREKDEEVLRATTSFEELDDAMDEVIVNTQKWTGVLHDLSKVKPYDINQYVASAKQQWNGTMNAASGVIPNFIRNPLSRIGDASFNWVDRKLAPWNAVQRTWNSGIGAAVTNGLGIAFGPVGALAGGALTGGINAVSQIAGNAYQAKMETSMLGIQNALNTLGAITSWISTPFKLLHKVTKLLIGSFSGLTLSINNFMKNGIGMMSNMGNPLSELTGINYSAYEGTTMLDVASLFNKGSMNSIYEDFAKQQKAFYTLGQVNTNRLIASSLLGVYSDVYNPTTDAEGSYNTMVNKLLASMQGQSEEQKARTMYLASEIDSNLPSLLRTANLLGVTDINQLTNPRNRGMYWRTLTDDESKQFRWTQYEYGAASSQFGYSKMRLSNTIWNAVGKDLYNGINEIIDKLAGGDIESAMDAAVNTWNIFSDKLKAAWSRIKAYFTGEDENGESSWGKAFKIIGLQAINTALDVAKSIVSIWDAVVGQLLNKAQGLIAYLSTVRLEPTWENGKLGINISTLKDVTAQGSERIFETYRSQGEDVLTGRYKSGMSYIGKLYDMLFPNAGSGKKTTATIDDIKAKFKALRAAGLNTIGLSELGIEQMGTDEASVNSLLDNLLRRGVTDRGEWVDAAAAFLTPNYYNTKIDKQSFYDEMGLMDVYRAFTNGEGGILSTVIDTIKDTNNKTILELKVTDGTGKVRAQTKLTEEATTTVKNLLQLSNLVADNVSLAVQKISGD